MCSDPDCRYPPPRARSQRPDAELWRHQEPSWETQALIRAINDVSFQIAEGETLGLVGESGSGKSTIGRAVLHLETPDEGSVRFRGQELTHLGPQGLKPYRRQMQMIFQDLYSALNPRIKVGRFVAEPMVVHGTHKGPDLQDRVADLFNLVGLDPSFMNRHPHEFSGGQRQRINIARAIALNPAFIVADEPITALDVSIQAQIVNLFKDLQDQLGLAYLFIAHDLSMVRYLCQRVAVMLRGRIVELAPTEQIFSDPRHPYTRSLLAEIPVPDPDRKRPDRTPFDVAANIPPREAQMIEVAPGHFVLDHEIQ